MRHADKHSAVVALRSHFRNARAAWVLLVISLTLTFAGWLLTSHLVQQAINERFRFEAEHAFLAVSERMQKQERALAGGAGLFAASEKVSRSEWKAYVDALQLSERYPGMLGLGFSMVVPPSELAHHTEAVRREGFPQYRVQPEGPRQSYTSIVFLEPFAGRNLRAFGYDMFSEPTRRAAMERARDTGAMAVSGIVTLVQETNKDVQRGFLMYLPIYRNGMPTATVEQRRTALVGFVYSPFRVNDLMAGILGNAPEHIDLHIFDANKLLYDTDGSENEVADWSTEQLTAQKQLPVGGRNWRIAFAAKPSFVASGELREPWMVLTGGLAISALVFFLVLSLSNQKRRAEALAEKRTLELRTAQATLELSHARFREFAELSTDWFWETDDKCLITSIHDGANSRRSVDMSQFFGIRLGADRVPGMSDEDWAVLENAVAKHKPFRQCSVTLRGTDRTLRTLTASGKPKFDAAGTFQGYIGTARDITLEVEARNALAEAEQKLLQAMEVAPGGISLVDVNGRLIASNSESRDSRTRNGQYTVIGKAYAEILDEAITRGGGEIAGDPSPLSGATLYRRLLDSVAPFECRLGRHWYLVRSTQLSDGTLVVGSSDITALKNREREYAEARAAAESANRYKTEFLATMSHELRNPLTSIIGALSIIIANPGGTLPEKVQRLMQLALDNSRRLVKLINETLDVERIESGLASFNVAPVKLLDVVRPAIEAMRGLAASRGVRVSLDPASSHDVVRGDADRLQQVAINLLSNAIKFSPENGEVQVTVHHEDNQLRLSVKDHGPGIPETFRSHIFERFAQAPTASPTKDGSGLGLAIAKSIIDQLGGTISFDTTEGQGTVFHVDLPLAAPDAVEREVA